MKRASVSCNLLVASVLFALSLLIAAGCPQPNQEVTRSDTPKTPKSQSRKTTSEPAAKSVSKTPDVVEIKTPEDVVEPKERHYAELFEGWPEPQFVLMVSGRQHGYIEPCGCAGLEHQKGGLARRHTFVRELVEKKGWKVAKVDVGNQVRRFGKQPGIKFKRAIEGLGIIGYDAVGFGPDDLRLGIDMATNLIENPGVFVVANATVFGADLTLPYKVITAGDKKIGVTAVFGDEHQDKNNEGIEFTAAADGLAAVWPKLAEENCDLYVLLAHTSLEDSTKLAQAFPKFDVVVTAGGATEPPSNAKPISGTDAIMVEVGEKGMYVGVIGVFDDDEQPLRFQKVPLDDRFADSKEMLDLMKAYQDELKFQGFENLQVKTQGHPTGRKFAGSVSCKRCHEKQYDIWKNGLDGLPGYHSHATVSLTHPPNDRSHIPRHHDPECLSCHVTGWNPQKYYPYETGYLKLDDERLHGNGCENCHGPGAEHIKLADALEAGTIELTRQDTIKQLHLPMRLTLKQAEKACYDCHDLDNSPDFDFEEYWSRIEHYD